MADAEKGPLIFGQHLNPTGQTVLLEPHDRLIPMMPDGNVTITGPRWEPIGDQHKEGRPLLVALHQDRPRLKYLVTWGMILGEPRWCSSDSFYAYPQDHFTHAYIVPPFEPEKG